MREFVGMMLHQNTKEARMHAQTAIYIVRTKDMTLIRRVSARSEREAVSKVTRNHGVQDYIVFQF
jgi:hypothetical protein